ncbi:MAG: DUF1059 domain-containing protein [Candidatus Micrarchaeia archaeon]
MKSFACRDIGLSCDFKAESDNEADLMKKIAEHARTVHHMNNIDAATMSKIKKAIKNF